MTDGVHGLLVPRIRDEGALREAIRSALADSAGGPRAASRPHAIASRPTCHLNDVCGALNQSTKNCSIAVARNDRSRKLVLMNIRVTGEGGAQALLGDAKFIGEWSRLRRCVSMGHGISGP